jgi:hypothetical protein
MIEQRIEKIESSFTGMLEIRNNRSPMPWYAKVPETIITLILPTTFLLVWAYQVAGS